MNLTCAKARPAKIRLAYKRRSRVAVDEMKDVVGISCQSDDRNVNPAGENGKGKRAKQFRSRSRSRSRTQVDGLKTGAEESGEYEWTKKGEKMIRRMQFGLQN